MENKRAKKNKRLTRIAKLKKRRRRITGIIFICTIVFLFLSGLIFNKVYVSYKCKNLTYAVDHYFTTWKDKDLRINRVQTMSLIDKNNNTATIEAYGLGYNEPHQRTTLVGSFVKNDNGSWKMTEVQVKTPSN